jgi:AraC-like DNA-binding protein
LAKLIRAASLSGYVELARSMGLNSTRLLKAVDLDSAVIADPDNRVPARALVQLLELSASASGIEDFGLRLSELREFTNLGPLSLVARDEPVVRGALAVFIAYLHLHNEALRIDMNEQDGQAILSLHVELNEPLVMRQSIELAVGALFRILRQLLGSKWQHELVAFAHGRPRGSTAHRRIFGGRIEFDHDFSGFVCLSHDLDRPNPMANPSFRRYAQQYLHLIDQPRSATTVEQVRQMIFGLLPAGRCSMKTVAHSLGVKRQTVHRHLAASGTTYSHLLDDVRGDLATRYVLDSGRRIAEIGGMLGFSETSGFSRWFRRRFGVAPRTWRHQKQALASTVRPRTRAGLLDRESEHLKRPFENQGRERKQGGT